MNCQDLPLADFVDGDLDATGVRSVERHLEGCAACRLLVADLRTIRAAAFTLDRRAPRPELLATLRARVAAEPASSRVLAWPNTRPALAVWLAAAAALVLATLISVLPLLRDADPATTTRSDAGPAASSDLGSVEADLAAAEELYERAISKLEQIAKSDSGELDPQVAAVLQKNLQVIDQAIGESRGALRTQPTSVSAQDSLFEAMRNKVALLQQTVELINEMRKGNSVEAGRLMQDINR